MTRLETVWYVPVSVEEAVKLKEANWQHSARAEWIKQSGCQVWTEMDLLTDLLSTNIPLLFHR